MPRSGRAVATIAGALALSAALAAALGVAPPLAAAWTAAASALAAAAAAWFAPRVAGAAVPEADAPVAPPASAVPHDAARSLDALAGDAAADAAAAAFRACEAALGHVARGALAARVPAGPEAARAANAALAVAQSALDEAIALAELMAAGDLSVEGSSGHPGAYGDLLKGLNAVGSGMRALMGAMRGAVGDVATRSEGLSAAAGELSARIHEQVAALDEARDAGATLEASVGRVEQAAAAGDAAAARAAAVAQEGRRRSDGATAAIGRVSQNSRRIAQVLDAILQIARQTKLLGVNAAVEAARVGEAGRGFAVVAAEIQALAAKAADAAETIEGFVKESDAAVADAQGEVAGAADTLSAVGGEIDAVAAAAAAIRAACAEQTAALSLALARIGAADDAARAGEATAAGAAEAAEALDRVAEALRARLAGALLVDVEMATAAQRAAAEASARFEAAVSSGRITRDALFSRDYRPIEGTDPPQFMTDFVAFTDETLTPIIEGLLGLGDHVVFACAVNEDGFLPTHNRKFSKPQGADPVWNTANCRNRRFFDDRVGLAAGRSEAPSLIQAYRRDMGGGAYAVMKDASAPIRVFGRRWGGLRIGYRPRAAGLAGGARRAA